MKPFFTWIRFRLCRRLCVAGNSGHVILFKFRKLESVSETLVLEIPITYENFDDAESPECEFVPRSLPKQPDSTENDKKVTFKHNLRAILCNLIWIDALQNDGMLRVRPGTQRKSPGFQPQLVCLTPWTNGSHPGQITSLCINSSFGLWVTFIDFKRFYCLCCLCIELLWLSCCEEWL